MYESVIALTIWENERTKKTHNIASNKLNNIVFIMYIYLLHAFKPEKKMLLVYICRFSAHIYQTHFVWTRSETACWFNDDGVKCTKERKRILRKKVYFIQCTKIDEIKNKKNFNTPKQKYYQKILNATANRKQNPVISKASFSCALEIL